MKKIILSVLLIVGISACGGSDPSLTKIEITSNRSHVSINETLTFSAKGTYSDDSTKDVTSSVKWNSSDSEIVSVPSKGQASGKSLGSSKISATLDSVTSNAKSINVRTLAYIGDVSTNKVSVCTIKSNSGQFTNCEDSGVGALFSQPNSIAIDSGNNIVFVSNSASTSITKCSLDAETGRFIKCVDSGAGGLDITPYSLTLNSTASYLYVSSPFDTEITYCSVDKETDALGSCTALSLGISSKFSITLDASNTRAYVLSGDSTTKIFLCAVNTNGSLSDCEESGSGLTSTPIQGSINAKGNILYVSSNLANDIFMCPIHVTNGILDACVSAGGSGFSQPIAVTIDQTNTHLYTSNGASTTVTVCSIASNGTLNDCKNAQADSSITFSGPNSVALK